MRLARTAALATSLFALGCAKTQLAPLCPDHYSDADGRCVCSDDQGCPIGYICTNAVCACNSDLCCPAGYTFDRAMDVCTCGAGACCPQHYVWDDKEKNCACGSVDCCPRDFAFDEALSRCLCEKDACCPTGFKYGAAARSCQCDWTSALTAASCCPVDDSPDFVGQACVSHECPTGYVFDQAINACKCVAQTCCPQTYQFDAAHQKCVCTASACPGGLYCEQNVADPYFGVCKCADNTPCKSDQFCNADHFCQSLSGCTSSFDCPAGTFCDTITSVCRATGSCTMDEHCDPGQICRKSDGKCIAGCRRDEDCPLLPVPLAPGASQFSCQAGQCVQFCKSNEYCPLGKRCDQGSGTCLTIPSYDPYAALCQKCGAIGCGSSGVCLMFIAEGQLGSFCGVQCVSNDDCPSGYDCGNILYDCGQGGTCPDGSFCKQFQVENEPAPLSLCADPKTGWPKDFDTYCAPRSGTCPPENG